MIALRRSFALTLAITFTLLLAACDQTEATPTAFVPAPPTSSANGEIVVFAASSLTDAFNEIAKGATSTDSGIKKVTYNFAGSQTLVTQLSQGAKADLLFTADEKTMRSAVDAALILTNTYRTFASNKLTVVTAPGSSAKVSTLQDLGKPGL
jgi:molybdate transport system substrate-binding protein